MQARDMLRTKGVIPITDNALRITNQLLTIINPACLRVCVSAKIKFETFTKIRHHKSCRNAKISILFTSEFRFSKQSYSHSAISISSLTWPLGLGTKYTSLKKRGTVVRTIHPELVGVREVEGEVGIKSGSFILQPKVD